MFSVGKREMLKLQSDFLDMYILQIRPFTIRRPRYFKPFLILTQIYIHTPLADFNLENPIIILTQRSIRHHRPDVWNTLPANLKQCTTLNTYKASFKTHLLSNYTE